MTYLFTWNPGEWDWEDFADRCAEVREKGFYEGRWSSGVSKSIPEGERFFFLKQGEEPRGIIGSGRINSDTYEDDNWREGEKRKKRKATFNDLHWDVLLNYDEVEILSVDELQAELPISHNWQPMASGTSIKDENIARELEIRWQKHLKRIGWNQEIPDDLSQMPGNFSTREGRAKLARHLTRERDPKVVSMKKEEVLRRTGRLECEACSFDFLAVYGEMGRGFSECHHRLPMNNGVRKTKLEDLAIICPNCHRMLHRTAEEITVEGLSMHIADQRNRRNLPKS